MNKQVEAIEIFNSIPEDFLVNNTSVSRYTDFDSYLKTYDDDDWKILKQEMIKNPTSSLKEIIDSMWMNYDNDIKLGEVYYKSSGFDEYIDCLTQWGKETGLSEERIHELCDELAVYVQSEWEKQQGHSLDELHPTMKAINIKWDIDEDDEYDEDVELPDEIEIPNGMTDEDEISDYLSDVTGFCHDGFELVVCDSKNIEMNYYNFTVNYSENGVQKIFEIGTSAKEKPDNVWLAQKISDSFSAIYNGSLEKAIGSVEGIDVLIENGKGEYVDSDEIYGDDLKALFEHLKEDKPRLDAVISAAEQSRGTVSDKEVPGVEQER